MTLTMCLLPQAISELFAQITQTGEITLADRYGLLAATFNENLTDDERLALNRLLRAASLSQFRIVNKLSAIA
ncbi:MAG: hypothetical protein AAFZ49_05630 [Cyanobacteria bacterium J06659_2]